MKYTIFLFLLIVFFISCEKDSSIEVDNTGVPGSTAKFTILGNYLYVVDNSNLNIFDIHNESKPVLVNSFLVGFDIETIFGYNEHLFIGSQWGMYIYSTATPATPTYVSQYNHLYSCDPVVVNDSLAFYTLRSGSDCRGASNINELAVIDIKNKYNPYLLSSYTMTSPYGLSIDSNFLFVCDEGVKVYDFSNPQNLVNINHIEAISARDVISINGILYVVAENGLYQYNYTRIDSIVLISKMLVY